MTRKMAVIHVSSKDSKNAAHSFSSRIFFEYPHRLFPSLSSLMHASLGECRYHPALMTLFMIIVEIKGFEPLTPCLQGRCSPN